ncbi:centrosomal protein of 41 kDa isoform X4 [Hypanus sabinus]|uniref:centrosomal protein of 41 kDa isoform X4 n=1 Tax=Hypanus sabinus TaxID=79690 RepID=UPI0028C3932B|nr:centrosomal protein of 41 kDa isoform X4 [Hypanus sabinus]
MSLKNPIGNPEFLKKRVVPNPKYNYVRARIDTGHSLSKYMEKIEELRRNYRYKRDELFKRLKVTTFAQLVLQVASVNEQDNGVFEDLQQEEDLNSVVSANEPELGAIKRNDDQSPVEKTQKSPIELISNDESDEKPLTARSTLQSVISGVGEIDLERKQKEFHSKPSECPEKTDGPYPDCPYLLLDVRDRDAYEKCHIIGGLKVVAQMFPQGLTTGSIPPSCQPPVVPTPRQRRSTAQEPTLPAEDKFRFTEEDLNKIRYSLDEILVPASNYSHLSSSRTRLKTSASHTSSLAGSISARSRTSSIQSKPWK